MTSKGGNAAWRALRDDANAAGDPLPPDPGGPWDDLWPLLSVAQQQLVASGRVTLEDLVDRITASGSAELCPRCAAAPISPMYSRFGLCAACARREMSAALNEVLVEVEAQREADVLKQRVHRAREDAGLPLPRAGE